MMQARQHSCNGTELESGVNEKSDLPKKQGKHRLFKSIDVADSNKQPRNLDTCKGLRKKTISI